jgi:3-hydroxybutyryl-CoA dehydrogenase
LAIAEGLVVLIQISEKLLVLSMNILVIGNDAHLQECREKFGGVHQYKLAMHQQEAVIFFDTADVIFDFIVDEGYQTEFYQNYLKGIVFLNTSFVTLAKLTDKIRNPINRIFFGFCGMPTFLNRELLEVSLRSQQDSAQLQQICKTLNTDYVVVDDQVGLVTPRVICMIINEAFYTVQEGTATKEDIDVAMKLGTNYPFGPFEWSEKIGLENIKRLLSAVYEDTRDERYKICPLLENNSDNDLDQSC